MRYLVSVITFAFTVFGMLTAGLADALTYEYNNRSELIKVRYGINTLFSWEYDLAGNLKYYSYGTATNYYSCNNLNQYTEIRTSNGNVYNFTYDVDGNLTSDSFRRFVWDSANRLVCVEPLVPTHGSIVVSNAYDSAGRRVIKDIFLVSLKNDGSGGFVRQLKERHIFFYDDWKIVYEVVKYPDGSQSKRDYVWGKDLSGTLNGAGGIGGLLYVKIDGKIYIPIYDEFGNVCEYRDDQGNMVASLLYNPYGQSLRMRGKRETFLKLRFWYQTKYFDEECGLYNFGYRYYYPALCRWVNRDPLEEEGGVHLYRYVNNSPTIKHDPNGLFPLDTVWDIANVIYDICVGDEVALAADTAALFVPYVPAGTTKLVKAARLSQVEKICPGVKRLDVTYKYNPYSNNHFLFQNGKPPVTKNWKDMKWVLFTKNGKAQFRPGFTHQDAKNLIDKALQQAKSQGKIRPSELDKYIFDAGANIGAHNGKPTSLIQLKVTPQGEIHIHPVSR